MASHKTEELQATDLRGKYVVRRRITLKGRHYVKEICCNNPAYGHERLNDWHRQKLDELGLMEIDND